MKLFGRKIILISIGCILLGCSPKREKMNLLVGTYTDNGSEGIYQLSFDPENGKLTDLRLAAEASNPSYLAISEDRRFVYSAGEKPSGSISVYKWMQDQGRLELIDKASAAGNNPCYIDISKSAKMVAIANYSSGNAAFYRLEDDGELPEEPFVFQHEGSGPNEARQEGPHAHCSIFSKDSRFVYVVDLGIDQVKVYPVQDGIVGQGVTALTLAPGDGPRHLVFHPQKDLAFIVNELSNSIVSVRVDPKTGKMEEIERASSLPDDFTEHSQAADIHITSNGKFLYASNRGHNSIAIFSVGAAGQLNRIGIESVRGDWPRNFVLTPKENFLIVGNQNSGNIVVFAIDKQTGLLTYTGNEISLSKPVCLKF